MPAEILLPCSEQEEGSVSLPDIPPEQLWVPVRDYPDALRCAQWLRGRLRERQAAPDFPEQTDRV